MTCSNAKHDGKCNASCERYVLGNSKNMTLVLYQLRVSKIRKCDNMDTGAPRTAYVGETVHLCLLIRNRQNQRLSHVTCSGKNNGPHWWARGTSHASTGQLCGLTNGSV